MTVGRDIPVIDLFAGPGGLGEGFSALRMATGERAFRVRLSVEMDRCSHQTLLLRSFFRQFGDGEAPSAYYEYLRGEERWAGASVDDLLAAFPAEGRRAAAEAWCEELRPEVADAVDDRVNAALGSRRRRGPWVLIGGPPCQAYSLVGRARMLAQQGDRFYEDGRHTLYREYLRIISEHAPSVFVMENVKGLLSATSKSGDLVFQRILQDLQNPPQSNLKYRLLPLSVSAEDSSRLALGWADPARFLVRCEHHGIPQARHRVIIVGVLQSAFGSDPCLRRLLPRSDKPVGCAAAIDDLPRLRSGVSRGVDSMEDWLEILRSATRERWFREASSNGQFDVATAVRGAVKGLTKPRAGRGCRFIEWSVTPKFSPEWFRDDRLNGVLNHETRGHRADDLHRYLYVSCYGKERGDSPRLADFPVGLLPQHRNTAAALNGGMFNDRFRVQIAKAPATTVTSHISKDGHAYIHHEPTQCRSLTVREAARLQTFPDNYFFEGPRTEQYRQVGNAVPPLLAREVASIVAEGLERGWR